MGGKRAEVTESADAGTGRSKRITGLEIGERIHAAGHDMATLTPDCSEPQVEFGDPCKGIAEAFPLGDSGRDTPEPDPKVRSRPVKSRERFLFLSVRFGSGHHLPYGWERSGE
ncbi:hypothetical protein llap_15816 [Limosa lapponica baueri]|uniref:Uncharacterized protein n=1 Tax=Limosa lapponica baueri TaxID=1758121 RepID=A0A2I0TJ82_LIMLA|nr:hypothetical protein llap_15816 [Limosa lapponica baueri]